jgi:PIN domain nuclease of toxin-antitoxin system
MILMDTHILLWFQQGNTALSQKYVDVLTEAQKKRQLFLSVISVWEIAMLEKLQRIAFHQPLEPWLREAIKGINVIPITAEIAVESVRLPSYEPKDPADRFIIATARTLNYPLMTHDQKIIHYAKLGHIEVI